MLGAEDARPDRVKRSQPDARKARTERSLQAYAHLTRRLIRKRESEDRPRRVPFGKKV